MRSIHKPCRWILACFALLLASYPLRLNSQDDAWEEDFKTAPPAGKRTFTSTCAGCHGLDGRGSERAPSIASNAKLQHASDADLAKIISNGVSGTGMPAFHTLTAGQVRGLVSYVRFLQGRQDGRALPGDSAHGREIFFGKGECSSCHAVSGQGGFLGPDLTNYGSRLSASEIQKAIVDSARIVPDGYKAAGVTTGDGTRLEGVVRNEDNFSLQLLTRDGRFHFFEKNELQAVHYREQSLMPVDYAGRLDQKELRDLISYLMTAGASSKANSISRKQAKASE